jgi:hypothetical protein
MRFFRTIRSLRAWLLAMFVAAQLGGIVPLLYDHTLNVFEGSPVAGHTHVHVAVSITTPDADHHHGLLDLHDQCCALHTLAGPLPTMSGAAPAELAGARMAVAVTTSLAQGRPALPDRPPRSLPLI